MITILFIVLIVSVIMIFRVTEPESYSLASLYGSVILFVALVVVFDLRVSNNYTYGFTSVRVMDTLYDFPLIVPNWLRR